jgi:hypothetical protein
VRCHPPLPPDLARHGPRAVSRGARVARSEGWLPCWERGSLAQWPLDPPCLLLAFVVVTVSVSVPLPCPAPLFFGERCGRIVHIANVSFHMCARRRMALAPPMIQGNDDSKSGRQVVVAGC